VWLLGCSSLFNDAATEMIYAVEYLAFATAVSAGALVAWFLVYGVYFALSRGRRAGARRRSVPADRHGAAFGVYNAALGVGALAASMMFGVLYEQFGAGTAFRTGAGLAAAAALALVLVRTDAGRDAKIERSNVSDSRDQ
jgi:predicted MFS family arabinose efflux permease